MIYCPNCGTANRDGSKFCNSCGEQLGTQTRVKCPHCGTMNPVHNVLCIQCRARLLPSPASTPDTDAGPTIKGLSLPTKTPLDEYDNDKTAASRRTPDDEIPTWLRELGATLTEEDQAAEIDRPNDASEIPDWLQDLRASLPEDSEVELDRIEQEEERPDWLAELRPAAEAAEPEHATPTPEPGDEQMTDWLARLRHSAEEAEPEPATPTPESGEEALPDWLTELRPVAEEPEPEPATPTPEPGEEEMPAWLAELRPAAEEAEPGPATPTPVAGEEEMPAWLAELRPATEEAEPEPATPTPVAGEEEMPDWLAELRPAAEEAEPEPATPTPAPQEEALPDWLAEPEFETEEGALETGLPDLQAEEEEIPAWLAELETALGEEEPETELAPPDLKIEAGAVVEIMTAEEESEIASFALEAEGTEFFGVVAELPETEAPEAEEISDQLTELQAEMIEVEPVAEPSIPIDDIEAGEIPDWLSEFQPSGVEEEPTTEALSAEEIAVAAAAAAAAVPDWLAALDLEGEEEATPSIEGMAAEMEAPAWPPPVKPGWEGDDTLVPAEIPAWLLALKPSELRGEGEAEAAGVALEESTDDTGLLAGLRGILPVEMLIAQPRAATEAGASDVLASDSPQARMFADVVGRPPAAAPKAVISAPSHILSEMPRWIIYIALIVAVTIPVLLGKPLIPRTIEPTRAEEDLYTAIEALGSDAPVLVAFDYDPTTSGEMDVLAQALVGQLMDGGARVVAMSLLPAGPATAQPVLDKLADARPDYVDSYGQRYANLGYLPGQAAAVRLMGLSLQAALPEDYYGTPLGELPVMQGLTRTQSFELVVELAATQDTLRWWVEQAGAPYDIPLAAGVSASVAPLASPYYETEQKQLVGLVGGVPGAVNYEALRGGQAGPPAELAARLDSLLAGYAILILVLLIGNVAYLAQRGARREP